MRRIALLIACLAAPALAADQFDLACRGSRLLKRDGAGEPYAFRVRVDLAARRWCLDDCRLVMDINTVEPDRIVFQDDLILNTREEATRDATLDRRTNAFRRILIIARPEESYSKVEATCTVQPFTALPAGGAPNG